MTYRDTVNSVFKKHGKIAKILLAKKEVDPNYVTALHYFYIKYRDIIKQEIPNFIKLLEKHSLELLIDFVYEKIRDRKITSFIKTLFGNKYKFLNTERVFLKLWRIIYDREFTTSEIKEVLGKKLASFYTEIDLEVYLSELLKSKNYLDRLDELDEFNLSGEDFIKLENNIIINCKDNYDLVNKLSPPVWCIKRKQHFLNYVKRGRAFWIIIQYDKYNMNKFDVYGVTITQKRNIIHSHNWDNKIQLPPSHCLKYLKPLGYLDIIKPKKLKRDLTFITWGIFANFPYHVIRIIFSSLRFLLNRLGSNDRIKMKI